ncbi:MAG: hypothetical protein K2J60_17625 [Acetatifactor sp.]|nr:hypothetical protein [Acetatifactor sp.]
MIGFDAKKLASFGRKPMNAIGRWESVMRSMRKSQRAEAAKGRQPVIDLTVVCFFVTFFRENTLQINSDYGTLEDRVMIKK